jgi:hypothetical protein
MQAIVTKFIAPSNVKGSRINASAQAGSVTLHWDHALNPEDNHCAAALALATKYDWDGEWIGAQLPDGSTVWACNCNANTDRFTLKAETHA